MVQISDADLAGLRLRLRQTRWPTRWPSSSLFPGVAQDEVRRLAGYWADGYDWRAQEAAINALPSHTVEIAGAPLLAWMLEKYRAWTDPASRLDDDFVVTQASLYWFTNTISTSLRPYFEDGRNLARPITRVDVPTAVAVFPYDLVHPPRSWAERVYHVTRYTRMARGGHFAAYEVPDLLAAETSRNSSATCAPDSNGPVPTFRCQGYRGRRPSDLAKPPRVRSRGEHLGGAYDAAVGSSLTVRPARVEDVAQMARVNVRCWQETYRGIMSDAVLDDPGFLAARERFWTAALTDERYRENCAAVAERDGELIGIAMSGPPLDDAASWTRQLYVLYVCAADHGTGAGPALLQAVMDPAESAALWVADPNPRAQAFYRKHGFVADGTAQVEDGVREIRMVRNVQPDR